LINAYAAVLAAQGNTGSTDPLLFLAVSSLSFGASDTDLTVQVMNVGGGVLDVTGVTATSDTGNWLSASSVAASDMSATNVSAVKVHVDRSGLADALYTGTVTVSSSNGGDQSIAVTMVVQHMTPPVNVDLFVLAVDATTLETKAQTKVNPTTGLGWGMFNVPAGNYIIVCGSDDDHNNTICDDGDTYCGLYPTLNSPQAVGLGSTPVGSLDFTVGAEGTSTLDQERAIAAIRAKGLHILH
jgi:serine protease